MDKNNWKMKCTYAGNSSWEIGDVLVVNNNRCKHDACTVDGDFSSFDNWCNQRAVLGSKWELIEEVFTKSDLQECDVVTFRNKERLVYFGSKFMNEGYGTRVYMYEESLKRNDDEKQFDIIQVYRNGVLIFNRIEEPVKSHMQIEIESMKEEQRKLADRLSELRKGL